MALPHQSIATIQSPEFINLQPLDVNPLMSKCEIKVLYVGENRNRSYISKEVAIDMAKTLRGAPIVGYFKENTQDFADHGQQITLDDEGIHFNCLTKPYGFVSPDAKVWFQTFTDTDEFGNNIDREYLMTTGYLWTGQFQEVQTVVDDGRPQSMELEEKTLEGHWATNNKTNVEFFIINDATFTKLCILGNSTQPCFEGASVTKPMVSTNFSKTVDDNFKQTLFSMIEELRDALKGGNQMVKEEVTAVEEAPVVEETVETTETTFTEEPQSEEPVVESESVTSESVSEPIEPSFEKKEEQEEKQEENTEEEQDVKEEEDDEDKNKYSLLEQQYNELSTQYQELKQEYDKLVEFKTSVENERKDALINDDFYMLSEEDKKDVIENKANYTLDEIKAKLAVICYEKKVNFNSEDSEKIDNNTEQEIVTFTYGNDDTNLPDWVKAVKQIDNN